MGLLSVARSRAAWPLEIDWEHREADGLISLVVATPLGMVDLVQEVTGTRSGAADAPTTTRDGTLDCYFNGSDTKYQIPVVSTLDTSAAFTLVWEAELDSFTANNYPQIGAVKRGVANNPLVIFYSPASTTYNDLCVGTAASSGVTFTVPSGVSVTGERHWVVWSFAGGTWTTSSNHSVWVNGQTATFASASGKSIVTSTDETRLGFSPAGNYYWTGGIRQLRVYARQWSADEAWRFWAPQTRDELFLDRQRLILPVAVGGGGVDLTPFSGELLVTGNTPTISLPVELTPSSGECQVVGNAPELSLPVSLTPTSGVVSVTGNTPSLSLPVDLTPSSGVCLVTGNTPSLTLPVTLTPAASEIVVTGNVPTIDVGGGVTLTPASGVVSVTGSTPSISLPVTLTPSSGVALVTGGVPVINLPVTLTPGSGVLSVTGNVPTLSTGGGVTLTPESGYLQVVGNVPLLTIPVALTPGSGVLSVTGNRPTLAADVESDNHRRLLDSLVHQTFVRIADDRVFARRTQSFPFVRVVH